MDRTKHAPTPKRPKRVAVSGDPWWSVVARRSSSVRTAASTTPRKLRVKRYKKTPLDKLLLQRAAAKRLRRLGW